MSGTSVAVASSMARSASPASVPEAAGPDAESPLSDAEAMERLGHRFEQVGLHAPREAGAPRSSSLERLRMSHPGDAAEREADRLSRQVAGPSHAEPGGLTPPAVPAPAPMSPSHQTEVLSAASGGSVLAEEPRAQLEQAFGSDLGHVRLHTGADADRLTRSVRARAFTVREHVFFRQGAFAPQTPRGQALLAHEVVHTLQHRGGVSGPDRLPVSPAPAAGLHRVLEPKEEEELAKINAELEAFQKQIDALKYKAKMDKEKEIAPKRGQLLIRKAQLEAKKAQPSPEQQAQEEERVRQAQALKRQQEEQQAKALAEKEAELKPYSDAVKQSAKTIRTLYEKAFADSKEHPAPASMAKPQQILEMLKADDSQAAQAIGQANKVTLESEVSQAQALAASVQKLAAEAQTHYAAWEKALGAELQAANVQNQADKFTAATAIQHGYVHGAACTLHHTFVSNDDVDGGFCGEYRMGGKNWVIHVHRDSKGVWKKAHVKTQGDMTKGNSVDLSISGAGSCKAALEAMGVKQTDTTTTH